jgi:sterol desaturase/sphingolipid hydroxylase (fatty acid hydroxylase superfamily)
MMVFTVAVIALIMFLESVAPRRELKQALLFRWANNFSLAALTWYISSVVAAIFMFYLIGLADTREFGLMHYLEAGPLLSFLVVLTATQFVSYVVHFIFHKVSWLWPLHAMHHSDVDVDISTTYRHHPIEPLVFLPIGAPLIILLGIPLEVAMVYKLVEIAVQYFSHSNIRLPEGLDRVLRLFILTPDFHRLHHCSEPRFTNSNYSSVVPWFDYLFGTARTRPYDEQETMELGLEYLREERDSRLDRLIMIPLTWKKSVSRAVL